MWDLLAVAISEEPDQRDQADASGEQNTSQSQRLSEERDGMHGVSFP